MKGLIFISIVAMAVGVSAQTAAPSNEPAGLRIIRVGLQRTRVKGPTMRAVPSTNPSSQARARADQTRDVDSNPALHRLSRDAEIAPLSSSSAPFGNSGGGPSTVFVASIVVKNIGTKTVTAVHWEYLLFETGAKDPIKKIRVESKRTIPPGELAELTKQVNPKGNEHQAQITRIVYEDGSFWQPK